MADAKDKVTYGLMAAGSLIGGALPLITKETKNKPQSSEESSGEENTEEPAENQEEGKKAPRLKQTAKKPAIKAKQATDNVKESGKQIQDNLENKKKSAEDNAKNAGAQAKDTVAGKAKGARQAADASKVVYKGNKKVKETKGRISGLKNTVGEKVEKTGMKIQDQKNAQSKSSTNKAEKETEQPAQEAESNAPKKAKKVSKKTARRLTDATGLEQSAASAEPGVENAEESTLTQELERRPEETNEAEIDAYQSGSQNGSNMNHSLTDVMDTVNDFFKNYVAEPQRITSTEKQEGQWLVEIEALNKEGRKSKKETYQVQVDDHLEVTSYKRVDGNK
ncbi:hypothetical protein [Marinococcus halotolerans]|uniref:hypothetical protein n=1 Tax=Marinococcus halotolerans TaxID=301092 RepID=UPI0003B718AA|nr:hypothetical protein [Marinococcus halotolerans]